MILLYDFGIKLIEQNIKIIPYLLQNIGHYNWIKDAGDS